MEKVIWGGVARDAGVHGLTAMMCGLEMAGERYK